MFIVCSLVFRDMAFIWNMRNLVMIQYQYPGFQVCSCVFVIVTMFCTNKECLEVYMYSTSYWMLDHNSMDSMDSDGHVVASRSPNLSNTTAWLVVLNVKL